MWYEVVEEARDRLSQGIAQDVDEVVEQLIEESICEERYGAQLKAALLEHR